MLIAARCLPASPQARYDLSSASSAAPEGLLSTKQHVQIVVKVVVQAAAGGAALRVPHPQVHVLRHQLAGELRAEGEVAP